MWWWIRSATRPDGAVMLGGRAEAGAGLRIYLDGAAIADVAAGPDGAWATTLADVAAGIYTLRVDQLAADGTVTSRFETPFKRETLAALAAANRRRARGEPIQQASAAVSARCGTVQARHWLDAAPQAVAQPEAAGDSAVPDAAAAPTTVSRKPSQTAAAGRRGA